MDMKRIPKARMEELERRQQREREKHKRQQVQYVGREFALFPEPRRVNPSEVDDDITAKLGDHSKAIEFMTTDAVGVQPSSNNALLTSHIQTSASSSSVSGNSVNTTSIPTSSSSSSQRLLACPQQQQQSTQQTHHYQQQQQLRQQPYLKQTDNKPPYSGRGGYPGQPVKNDLRSSSGMAPPKGPPPLLPPPNSTITTVSNSSGTSNGCSSGNNPSTTTTGLLLPPPNGYLGPPRSSAPLHNGRFSKPLPKSINDIISKVDQTYRAPEQITKIAATPRTTIGEYNLNGPNRHKYSVGPIQPILGSPPSGADLLQSAVPPPITPISSLPATPNPLAASNTVAITSIGSSGVVVTVSASLTTTTMAVSTSEPILSVLKATPVPPSIRAILPIPKEPLKPLLVDKVGPALEKQNSTLENDLELSESDDDRRKQGRSRHNSSDSSPSDSSESGSEESSKSDHQKQQSSGQQMKVHAHHTIQQQQTAPTIGRSGVNKSTNDKPKVIESISGGRSSIYLNSNALGSAGSSSSGPSSSSSSNKTPSPSDSSKWHLSRYFNKKPAQVQNETPPSTNSLVVNSINVSMDEPTLLPGGAQIIPEATQPQLNTAIVKHEAATFGVTKKFAMHSDDDEEDNTSVRRNCDVRAATSNNTGAKSSISGVVPELLNEIKKESEVPLLNAAEFVAIPTSQIKHEVSGLSTTTTTTTTIAPMSLAGGTTTVTPYNTSSGNIGGSGRIRTPSASPQIRAKISGGVSRSGEFARINRLSVPRSDGAASNNSDDEGDGSISVRPTVPTLGPGGTLKIPGVPAAITALPPSPQPLHSGPTLPNSITVVPIDPLPTTAPISRRRKPRNSVGAVPANVDTSDEENVTSAGAALKRSGVTVSPAALRAAAGPGGKLYSEPVPTVTTKKGPGRPRKIAGGGTVSNQTSGATAAKGPILTAKKDVSNSSVTSSKKTTARRKVSRPNSTAATAKILTQTQQTAASAAIRAPSIDSSSLSSVSYLTSKSSSSSSDTDEEEGAISGSSSEEEDDTGAGAGASTSNRIIVQLNKRKPSHDDLPSTASTMAPSGLGKTNSAPKVTSSSSKRRRTTPKITPGDDIIDSDEDSSDSGSGSDSSVGNYAAVSSNPTAEALPGAVTGNVNNIHRAQNLQSPYKGSIPAAPISTSTSSSSSGSSSSSNSSCSGGEHSDTDRRTSTSTRCRSKHVKSGAKVSIGSINAASGNRLRRDKPKASDKNKNVTLTRIFNPKEGGAKKQGQVLVIDQSSGDQIGEQQQQKLISPNSSGYRTPSVSTSALPGTHDNSATTSTVITSHSPRLTPGHLKSPRALSQLTTGGSHRTPDRSSHSSTERKVQQQRIKTPSCTPTRTPPTTRTPTPTPAALLSAPISSPIRTSAVAPANIPSLICKVDLSRLQRILPEWRANTYRLSGGTSVVSRYLYHENILSVDLQATTARIAASNSGSVTPYSTGPRTPTTPLAPSDREKSRSRESLVGIGINGAGAGVMTNQRLNSNGPLSNLQVDGGSGCTTPKDQPVGYTAVPSAGFTGNNSPNTKQLKHEQLIKNEPGMELDSVPMMATNKSDVFCADTKFKTGSSVKQELLLLKQDYKSGLPAPTDYITSEKQGHHEEKSVASPVLQHLRASEETKSHRRKRSASSSPYKEKKRKKERADKYTKEGKDTKEGKESGTLLTPATTIKEREKDIAKPIATVGAIERDIGNGTIDGLASTNDTSRCAIAIIPPLSQNNNGHMEKDNQHVDSRQLPHTNHDRLLIARQLHPQQQQLTNFGTQNSSHSPAHLQTVGNSLVMSAIPNVSSSSSSSVQLPPPPPQVIYRSYFERDDDGLCDDISKNTKFLQEAVKRKHAADKEQNLFNQVTLYLEAVIYFLLSSAGLEQHRNSEEASWVMYKDTLNLIKFISSKFKHLQVSSSANELHEPHNKVAILSLRCQSLISLKLYKMKRTYCRTIINHCMEIFKSGRTEILNGNTPSSNSPSNSVCSQGSGSNTPPGRNMRQDMHTTLSHQNLYFNYLANCHDLWDQADRLVRQGNHTDFFIALDHENGPLTLHSSMYDLFRYVQSGLKKLKSAGTTATTSSTTTISGSSGSSTTNNSSATVDASTNVSSNITTSTSTTTTIINNYSNSVSANTLHSQ